MDYMEYYGYYRDGVFHNDKIMTTWVDRPTNLLSFMLYPRMLNLFMGHDPEYWRWIRHESIRDVEVPELLAYDLLFVKGKFGMDHFVPGRRYEVKFVIMMNDAYGLESELLVVFDYNNQKCKEKLNVVMPPKEWVQVKVGEFVGVARGTDSVDRDITFSMSSVEMGMKKGLIIEGVLIQPCAA